MTPEVVAIAILVAALARLLALGVAISISYSRFERDLFNFPARDQRADDDVEQVGGVPQPRIERCDAPADFNVHLV